MSLGRPDVWPLAADGTGPPPVSVAVVVDWRAVLFDVGLGDPPQAAIATVIAATTSNAITPRSQLEVPHLLENSTSKRAIQHEAPPPGAAAPQSDP